MKEWGVHPKYTKYVVSEDGIVKNRVTGKVCSISYPKGRATIKIEDDEGKTYKKSLAHMVALVWIPNPEGLTKVRHVNGNKKDNRSCNLEWYCKKSATGTKVKPSPTVKKPKHKRFSILDIPNSSVKSYCSKKEYVTYKGKSYLVSRPISNPQTNNVLTIEKQLAAIKMLRAGKTVEEVANALKVRCNQLYLWIEKTLDGNYSLLAQDSIEYSRFIKEHGTKGSAV